MCNIYKILLFIILIPYTNSLKGQIGSKSLWRNYKPKELKTLTMLSPKDTLVFGAISKYNKYSTLIDENKGSVTEVSKSNFASIFEQTATVFTDYYSTHPRPFNKETNVNINSYCDIILEYKKDGIATEELVPVGILQSYTPVELDGIDTIYSYKIVLEKTLYNGLEEKNNDGVIQRVNFEKKRSHHLEFTFFVYPHKNIAQIAEVKKCIIDYSFTYVGLAGGSSILNPNASISSFIDGTTNSFNIVNISNFQLGLNFKKSFSYRGKFFYKIGLFFNQIQFDNEISYSDFRLNEPENIANSTDTYTRIIEMNDNVNENLKLQGLQIPVGIGYSFINGPKLMLGGGLEVNTFVPIIDKTSNFTSGTVSFEGQYSQYNDLTISNFTNGGYQFNKDLELKDGGDKELAQQVSMFIMPNVEGHFITPQSIIVGAKVGYIVYSSSILKGKNLTDGVIYYEEDISNSQSMTESYIENLNISGLTFQLSVSIKINK